MNKGKWFSSPTKILLFFVNLTILGIACAIVCFTDPCVVAMYANRTSAVWDCMSLELLSTRARRRPAGLVPTMPPRFGHCYDGNTIPQKWFEVLVLYVYAYRYRLIYGVNWLDEPGHCK